MPIFYRQYINLKFSYSKGSCTGIKCNCALYLGKRTLPLKRESIAFENSSLGIIESVHERYNHQAHSPF